MNYQCPKCGNTLFNRGFSELYCGSCETIHNRHDLNVPLTEVVFPQTLLINDGGINNDYFFAITINPGGIAEIIWKDRVCKGDKYVLGRCKAAKYATYFQLCDRTGRSDREKTHLSIEFDYDQVLFFKLA